MVFFQLIFNSLAAGVLLAVVAIGFNLVFSTTKVFHLAHGAVYVCGAYNFILFLNLFGNGSFFLWLFALLASLAATALAAVLIEALVYQPLVRRNAGQAITLISSLGVYILLTNCLAMFFGNETKLEDPHFGGSITFGGIIIMPIQLVQLVVSSLFVGGAWWLSRRRWYLQVRALLSHETAAAVIGVNAKRMRLIVMLLGGMCAAVPAILRLYDTGIDPQAGMAVTLSAVVAVIIGGNGSIQGTFVAAMLIAFLQAIIEYLLSAQWREGVTFLLLMAVILARTEGIVSFKLRVEEK